jgi:3-mercaptopyruvate sulfurtransferase SseA
MRRIFLILFLACVSPLPAQQRAPVLVSTAWLAEHARDTTLVIFHVGNDASFTQGHIPGARPMPLTAFAPERNGLSTELPDSAAFRELLETAGVTNASRIVVLARTRRFSMADCARGARRIAPLPASPPPSYRVDE